MAFGECVVTTHPEDLGPIDPLTRLRSFPKGISLQEHLHLSLDRLLEEMVRLQETCGSVAVTVLDSTGPWAGRTVVLAVDLDPEDVTEDDRGD